MAEGRMYACTGCAFEVLAWSDGKPYYIDEQGKKQYAYHPNHDLLDRCIGNDVPTLSLDCAGEFESDSAAPASHCPRCKGQRIVPTFDLEGQRCPRCSTGTSMIDPKRMAVS